MHNEEENIRKKLGSKKPQDGFKVPANYFDTFSTKVKESIEANNATNKGFTLAKLLRPVYSIPLAVVVVLVAGYFIFFSAPATIAPPTKMAKTETITTEDLSAETIAAYLVEDVDLVGVDGDIEKELVLLAFEPEQAVTEPSYTTPTTPLTNGYDDTIQLSDKEIEEYLIETADDYLIESL